MQVNAPPGMNGINKMKAERASIQGKGINISLFAHKTQVERYIIFYQ